MPNLSNIISCPKDNSELVEENSLFYCKECQSRYPIINAIPRFVPEENYANSFGFEWEKFAKTQVDSFNDVGQSVLRIQNGMGWFEEDVKGKLVLDVGCGSGRFTEIMARWGAEVVGLDYSNAVDVAKKNTDELDYINCSYVQGDALKLPFKDNSFDAVFSIGVLQHTADPLRGLREMCRVLKPGGILGLHGVYVKSFKKLMHPKYFLRPITTKIPTETLFKIVKSWVSFSLPISRFLRKKLKLRQGLVERITAVANYEGAVPGIDDSNIYEWSLLDTFDWFSPRYDNPQKEVDIERVLNESGMVAIVKLQEGINYKAKKGSS